ncbi:hypothetical protein BDR04DRAFT_64401 [Suillus decipiens]|nr:hypothetical protein BDR04DRAFT_64401 [Suillus decipiens]
MEVSNSRKVFTIRLITTSICSLPVIFLTRLIITPFVHFFLRTHTQPYSSVPVP